MADVEPSQETLQPLAALDRIVHEPGRLAVLSLLFVLRTADFLFVMRQTGLTRGNLSSHMSKLETAGYVAVEKKFVGRVPRTLYHLTEQGREAFRVYRESLLRALGPLAPRA